MQRRVPSVEKLHRLTGFRPQIALPEIIDSTAAHLSSTMAAVRSATLGLDNAAPPKLSALQKKAPINIHLIDQLVLTDDVSLTREPNDLHSSELPDADGAGRAETERPSVVRRSGGPLDRPRQDEQQAQRHETWDFFSDRST
jgi:hypothetical protein